MLHTFVYVKVSERNVFYLYLQTKVAFLQYVAELCLAVDGINSYSTAGGCVDEVQ